MTWYVLVCVGMCCYMLLCLGMRCYECLGVGMQFVYGSNIFRRRKFYYL